MPFKFSDKEYIELCKATGKGRQAHADNYKLKIKILKEFSNISERLRAFASRNQITLENLQTFLCAKEEAPVSFNEFWQKFNMSKPVGTKNAYEGARLSFTRIVGQVNRTFITKEDVLKWEKGLEKKGASKTTVGIYERACRAAWNEAARQGLASLDDNPFHNIPAGKTRKKQWLPVAKMTELFDIFMTKRYPSEWRADHINFVHQAVGLFLFQYLANGCNMADVARMTYTNDFFQSEGKMISFIRHKTKERSGMEVVIPFIEPLHYIVNEIGSSPCLGQQIFPNILNGETNEEKIVKKVAQANKNVREGLRYLTSHLGWSITPSGTWARHSFATNLTHAGVPERYIIEAMGHSSGPITAKYIDLYPLDKQVEYNSLLLNIETAETKTNEETITINKKEFEEIMKLLKMNGLMLN